MPSPTGKPAPFGYLDVEPILEDREIDFIDQPDGLKAADVIQTAFPVRFVDEHRRTTGAKFMVMHPVLCLKNRACNTVDFEKYRTPHGLKQARAAGLCAREFLRERITVGDMRPVLKLNEEIFRFATKERRGMRIAVDYDIEPFDAVLVHELLPDMFRTRRYPQMKGIVEQLRQRQMMGGGE